jgi:O-methyltransferase
VAWYSECFEVAQENFAPYERVRLVRGTVPQTLATVPIEQVAYLSLDMNVAPPEVAALEFFWDKLAPGAPVMLDDYGWVGYRPQKDALDEFASRKGVEILTLPTGQGVILRPPR